MPGCFGAFCTGRPTKHKPTKKQENSRTTEQRSRAQYTTDSARSELVTKAQCSGLEAVAVAAPINTNNHVAVCQPIPETPDQPTSARETHVSDDCDADTQTGTLTRYHSADSAITNFHRGTSVCGDDVHGRSEPSPAEKPTQPIFQGRSVHASTEHAVAHTGLVQQPQSYSPISGASAEPTVVNAASQQHGVHEWNGTQSQGITKQAGKPIANKSVVEGCYIGSRENGADGRATLVVAGHMHDTLEPSTHSKPGTFKELTSSGQQALSTNSDTAKPLHGTEIAEPSSTAASAHRAIREVSVAAETAGVRQTEQQPLGHVSAQTSSSSTNIDNASVVAASRGFEVAPPHGVPPKPVSQANKEQLVVDKDGPIVVPNYDSGAVAAQQKVAPLTQAVEVESSPRDGHSNLGTFSVNSYSQGGTHAPSSFAEDSTPSPTTASTAGSPERPKLTDSSPKGVDGVALAPNTPDRGQSSADTEHNQDAPHHHFHAPNLARLSKKVSEKISHVLHHSRTHSKEEENTADEFHSPIHSPSTSPTSTSLTRLSRKISDIVTHHPPRTRSTTKDELDAGARLPSGIEEPTSPMHRLSRKISEKVSHALHPHAHTHPPPTDQLPTPTVSPRLAARQAFLSEYDSSFVAVCNKVYDTSATTLAEVPVLPVAPWNRRPGYVGYLTADQKKAFNWMRKTYPDSVHFHNDHDILRFLRARDFDLRETKIMYDKYLKKYRGQALCSPAPSVRPTHGAIFKLDLFSLLPNRDEKLTRRCKLMFDYFLHVAVFNTDREGRPVVYLKPSDSIMLHMKDHVPFEDRVALQCASIEASRLLCHMVSAAKGFNIEEMVHVVDLAGLNPITMMNHIRTPDAQAEFQYNTDFHPESLFKVIIINAPFGAQAVWKAASVFLPPRTRSKFSILGKQYQADLLKQLGPENVPTCYGGKVKFEWHQHKPVRTLKYM